jgi:PD-(D/E)XK nuclease superfamily protein
MTPSHLSHSSLTCANECLKKFHLTRLSEVEDRLPSLPAKPRDVGILAHAYIEANFKDQSFLEKLAEQDHTEHHAEALQIFENWKKWFNIPESAWLFSEREGSTNVEGVPAPVIGYDDFVYEDNGVHVLRDFKTGWGTEVYSSYDFQGDLACLRYEREFPLVRLASEVEFVRRGIVSPRREWTDELRAATIARVQAIWNRIELNMEVENGRGLGLPPEAAWAATPGKHCTFCDYNTTCASALRVSAAHLVVTDADSALATLREIALFEEAVKTMKAALKPYCAEYGDISTGDGKYDHRAGFSAAGRFTVGKG